MYLKWKDEIVVVPTDDKLHFKRISDDRMKIPYGLFGVNLEKSVITAEEFLRWAKKRCFPKERVDCKEILEMMGLEYYDRYEIIKKTNAILTEHDDFSVWWDDSEIPPELLR